MVLHVVVLYLYTHKSSLGLNAGSGIRHLSGRPNVHLRVGYLSLLYCPNARMARPPLYAQHGISYGVRMFALYDISFYKPQPIDHNPVHWSVM